MPSSYIDGDFILHFAGKKGRVRQLLVDYYYPKAKQVYTRMGGLGCGNILGYLDCLKNEVGLLVIYARSGISYIYIFTLALSEACQHVTYSSLSLSSPKPRHIIGIIAVDRLWRSTKGSEGVRIQPNR